LGSVLGGFAPFFLTFFGFFFFLGDEWLESVSVVVVTVDSLMGSYEFSPFWIFVELLPTPWPLTEYLAKKSKNILPFLVLSAAVSSVVVEVPGGSLNESSVQSDSSALVVVLIVPSELGPGVGWVEVLACGAGGRYMGGRLSVITMASTSLCLEQGQLTQIGLLWAQ
jgi:hypothetical protein